jgi:hypothetical protein
MSVIPDEFLGEAVITVSEFNECIEPAIKSVIRNRTYFKGLHIVKYGYNSDENLYADWANDLATLIHQNLAPVWHSEFDPSKMKQQAVIHIQPDHQIKNGALDILYKDMQKHSGQSLFAVTSETDLSEKKVTIKKLLQVPFYGFLLVILALDTLRSLFNLTRYHRTVDLRGQTVTTTYPRRAWLTERRWWLWFFYTRVCGTERGGPALGQTPVEKDRGIVFVLRHIKTHMGMGLGTWIFLYIFYYYLFAYPWWNGFFTSFAKTNMPQINTAITNLQWVFVRNPFSSLSIVVYCLNCIFVTAFATIYFTFPYRITALLCVLFPVFLTASPVWFLIGRFYISKASWYNMMEIDEVKE